MKFLHSSYCGEQGVSVLESKIQHKTARHVIFADKTIGKKEMVKYCYGSLVYQNYM